MEANDVCEKKNIKEKDLINKVKVRTQRGKQKNACKEYFGAYRAARQQPDIFNSFLPL